MTTTTQHNTPYPHTGY